jgi:hypothetical protein
MCDHTQLAASVQLKAARWPRQITECGTRKVRHGNHNKTRELSGGVGLFAKQPMVADPAAVGGFPTYHSKLRARTIAT